MVLSFALLHSFALVRVCAYVCLSFCLDGALLSVLLADQQLWLCDVRAVDQGLRQVQQTRRHCAFGVVWCGVVHSMHGPRTNLLPVLSSLCVRVCVCVCVCVCVLSGWFLKQAEEWGFFLCVVL